jgi:hypothetical protein
VCFRAGAVYTTDVHRYHEVVDEEITEDLTVRVSVLRAALDFDPAWNKISVTSDGDFSVVDVLGRGITIRSEIDGDLPTFPAFPTFDPKKQTTRCGDVSLKFLRKMRRTVKHGLPLSSLWPLEPWLHGQTPVCVNAQYLLDAALVSRSEMVTVQYGGRLDPILVTAPGFRGLVMPVEP